MKEYRAAIEARDRLRGELTALDKEHQRRMSEIHNALSEQEALIRAIEAGLDADSYRTAKEIVRVHWAGSGYTRTSEVASCFHDAREALRSRTGELDRCYFGVKSYDRFGSQRSDAEYGFGPRHGYIWFSIGRVAGGPSTATLTDEQIIACNRYLQAIEANPAAVLGPA